MEKRYGHDTHPSKGSQSVADENKSSLADENKSSFVKDRTIQNIILLMHEIVKGYRIRRPKCYASKMDIMKTFDTVNWKYLMLILMVMKFFESFLKWIWLYISTASFFISLNGSLTRTSKQQEGLDKRKLFPLPIHSCNGRLLPTLKKEDS